jgi:hypothetical protein
MTRQPQLIMTTPRGHRGAALAGHSDGRWSQVGCTNWPVPLPGVAQDVARDVAIRQLAAIWKDDIPIERTEHTFYPIVERLPGAAFTPTPLPSKLEDTTPIGPGDYEIPAHFYCAHVYRRNGSGYRYRLAKLEGKFSEALTQLYVRASKAGTPTREVQVLSWSMEARVAYDDLKPQQQALVDRLIPEYREQMQLGLTEKLMRDWETWSSRLPVPSFNETLAKMGDVGTYIRTLMRARQDILNKSYNCHALASVFVTWHGAPVPIDPEKTPWSRIHERSFMRFVAPKGAPNDGIIQIRILEGHSYHRQPSTMALVTETQPGARPSRRDHLCAQSDTLECTAEAIDEVERPTGPRSAQAAFAGSPGLDDLPSLLAQAGVLTWPEIFQWGKGLIIRVPKFGPIAWGVLIILLLSHIAVTAGNTQSITATTKTPSPEPQPSPRPRPTTDPIPPGPKPEDKRPPYVVRLQAQGGGVEESIVLSGQTPITVAEGVAGLEALKGKLSQRELRERARLFQQAERFIHNVAAGGGVGPPGKSFPLPRSDIRVDVQILRGINVRG